MSIIKMAATNPCVCACTCAWIRASARVCVHNSKRVCAWSEPDLHDADVLISTEAKAQFGVCTPNYTHAAVGEK